MLVTEEISNFNYINYIEDIRPKFIKKIKILDILKDIYFKYKLKRVFEIKIKNMIKTLVTETKIQGNKKQYFHKIYWIYPI